MKIKNVEFYTSKKQCDRIKEVKHLLTKEDSNFKSNPIEICRQNNLIFVALEIMNKKTNKKNITCRIVYTKTNLRYDKKFRYEIYTEKNCPKRYRTCPSKILKQLSATMDKEELFFRIDCKENLEVLAAERTFNGTLTNLPIDSKISLNKLDDKGNKIELVKESLTNYKYPIWANTNYPYEKYKIKEIQTIGYNVVYDASKK